MAQQLNLEDVKYIVREYTRIKIENEQLQMQWGMDDNQVGIAYRELSFEDICKMVLRKYNNTKTTKQ